MKALALFTAAWLAAAPLLALDPAQLGTAADQSRFANEPKLKAEQARAFRAWLVRIIDAQFRNGPTPRWTQRDCAGLLRFAVAEALRAHDEGWIRANGLTRPLPPELELTAAQSELRHSWKLSDGHREAFARALDIAQQNSVYLSKDPADAEIGDLLVFDQGDDQHLMIWMGGFIAWHTGNTSAGDDGLRAVSLRELNQWKDTRWRPNDDNPNFLGLYRLHFLAR